MDSVADHPDGWGFPIRISPDQSVLATPRSFSQPTTSFIASQCQGIRQTPLLCLISRFVSEETILRSPPRLVPCRGRPPPRQRPCLPFLPLRLGDGARISRLQTSSDERCQRTRRHIRGAKLYAHSTRPCVMMVEADGIEPTTSCLQSRGSPN